MAAALGRTRYMRFSRKIDRMRRRFAGWKRDRPKTVVRAPSIRHKVPRKPARQQAANGFNGRVIAQPPSPVPPTPAPDLRIPLPQRRSISELANGICRYPIGEPGTEGFFFCGGRAKDDRPYCRKHCAIAYRRDVGR